MLLRVYVAVAGGLRSVGQAAEEARQRSAGDAVAEGRPVFMRNACMNCHTIAGTVATGRFGPDLTHLVSRDTIASGAGSKHPENLRQWIARSRTP